VTRVEFIDENGGGPGVRLRKGAEEALKRRLVGLAGIEFIDEPGGGPGVRLRELSRIRKPT
jgi:hypothetical protein